MTTKKYTDIWCDSYSDNYPILSLSKTNTFKNYQTIDLLKNRPWFQYAQEGEKQNILNRLKELIDLTDDIKKIIKTKYDNLEIKHISIGGSYLFKKRPNDIDFDIIVDGSYFSYIDIFDVDELNKKLTVKVKKISFMVFGEKDFLRQTNINDTIEVEDYIHTSLCMREGLVFSLRNVTISGQMIEPKELDKKNLLVRIKRQLFHAELIAKGEVDLHRTADARLKKSIGRISEAFFLLSSSFPELKISVDDITKREMALNESLNVSDIFLWLEEIRTNIATCLSF